jgi:uncharacterized protein
VNVARLALCTLLMLPPLGHAAEGSPEVSPDLSDFPEASVTITHAAGSDRFRVWTADTDARKQQGLMFVRHMPRDRGMLFPQSAPGIAVMWMRNTYLSLDMVFIGENGVIVGITANATPLSPDIIASPGPVAAVLELNAGETARRGIRTGDRVTVERRDEIAAPPDAATSLSTGR